MHFVKVILWQVNLSPRISLTSIEQLKDGYIVFYCFKRMHYKMNNN